MDAHLFYTIFRHVVMQKIRQWFYFKLGFESKSQKIIFTNLHIFFYCNIQKV